MLSLLLHCSRKYLFSAQLRGNKSYCNLKGAPQDIRILDADDMISFYMNLPASFNTSTFC